MAKQPKITKSKPAKIAKLDKPQKTLCANNTQPAKSRPVSKPRPSKTQITMFFDELAQSSNIAASARAAGVSSNAMYRERRRDTLFAARWQAALCEGYARLEGELLAEALASPNGNIKDTTLKSRAQRHRLGLSLLAAHRAAVRGSGNNSSYSAQSQHKNNADTTPNPREKLLLKLRSMQQNTENNNSSKQNINTNSENTNQKDANINANERRTL